MLRTITLITALLLIAAPCAAEDFAVRDSVLAYWANGDAYFVGTIVEDKETGYLVVFEDGDTSQLKKTQVKKNDIKAGSKIVARWKDGEYYRGKVAKIVGRALYIQYNDGDEGWASWSWIAVKDEQ